MAIAQQSGKPGVVRPRHKLFTGHWEGVIDDVHPIQIQIDLTQDGKNLSGTLTIPAQGVFGLALTKPEVDGANVRFGFPSTQS